MLRRAQCGLRLLRAAASIRGPPRQNVAHCIATNWFSTAAAAVAKDTSMEQHSIVYDLPFALEVPENNEQVEAVQTIWEKIAEDVNKRKPYNMHPHKNKVRDAMVAWMEEGNTVSKELVTDLTVKLSARHDNSAGLQLMHWVVTKAPYEITDTERLLLIHFSSLRGRDEMAEKAFQKLSEKTEEAYQILLRGYTIHNNREKAEDIFRKMKELKLITSSMPYDLMLAMYYRLGDADSGSKILSEVNESGFPRSVYSYRVMEEFRESFKVEYSTKEIVEFMDKLKDRRLKGWEWKSSILLNGMMGRKEDVDRLWKEIEVEDFIPTSYYLVAAEAFGKIGSMETFKEICKIVETRHEGIVESQLAVMLKVYIDNGMMEEAVALQKQAYEAGTTYGYRGYHYLIAGCMKHGDPIRALEFFHESLEKCREGNRERLPSYFTLLVVMEAFALTKDVKGAEKIMSKLYESPRVVDIRMYNALLKVYIAAQQPVFGIEERMENDKVVPNAETRELLNKLKAVV